MKKLLFLIHTLGGGGAEKVLVNLVNNLPRDKYDVTVMTVIDTGIYKGLLHKDVHYRTMLRNPFPKKNQAQDKDNSGSLLNKKSLVKRLFIKGYTLFWKVIPAGIIYRVFIHDKYDYEIAFLEGICAKIIARSPNINSKKYAWIHVDMKIQHKSKHVFLSLDEEERVYNRFDKIVCVSNYVKCSFRELFKNIGESKLCVCYNAIDSNDILRKASQAFVEKGNVFTMCSVGRLNKQKSYIRLLTALNRLKNEGYTFLCNILGEGTDFDNLNRYVIQNNLENYIKFLGFQSNPYGIMKSSDMYVCSSIAEGFSTSVVEAVILGLPVVTTDCCGMREILGDSEYGVITSNDIDGLYNGIKGLMDNPRLLEYYRGESEKRGKEFDLQMSIKSVMNLFE